MAARRFCGSHRERVEAASALQSSRRRRRISLELDEFERPGGRALFEESPEVEAYLAALTMNPVPRARRASLDCPVSVHHMEESPERGFQGSKGPFGLVEGADMEEDEPLSPESVEEDKKVQPDSGAVNEQVGPTALHLAGFNHHHPAMTCNSRPSPSRNIFISARQACTNLMNKATKKTGRESRKDGSVNSKSKTAGTKSSGAVEMLSPEANSEPSVVSGCRIVARVKAVPQSSSAAAAAPSPSSSAGAGSGGSTAAKGVALPKEEPVAAVLGGGRPGAGGGIQLGGTGSKDECMNGCSEESPFLAPPTVPPPRGVMDAWAGEGNLQEWVDWSVVSEALRPPELLQAQQALIANSRNSGSLLASSTPR